MMSRIPRGPREVSTQCINKTRGLEVASLINTLCTDFPWTSRSPHLLLDSPVNLSVKVSQMLIALRSSDVVVNYDGVVELSTVVMFYKVCVICDSHPSPVPVFIFINIFLPYFIVLLNLDHTPCINFVNMVLKLVSILCDG